MLDSFKKNKFFQASYSIGVHVHLLSQGYDVRLCVLKRSGKTVKLLKQYNSLSEFEPDKKKLDEENPAYILSISGKGVVTKMIELSGMGGNENIYSKILPGASSQTFVMQSINGSQEQDMLGTLIRRESLNEALLYLKEHFIHPVQYLLGPAALTYNVPLLNSTSDNDIVSITYNNNKLVFRNNTLVDYVPVNDNDSGHELNLDGQLISEEQMPAFGAAFSYFTHNPALLIQSEDDIDANRVNFTDKLFYKKSLLVVVMFLAAVYFMNVIVLKQFSNKTAELNMQLSDNSVYLKKIALLQKDITEKETFLNKSGLLIWSRLSFFSDRLVNDLPGHIILNDLEVFPVKRSSDDENKFTFQSGILKVNGWCNESIQLNDWIAVLKKKNWIKDVQVLNYRQEKTESKGLFDLEIKLK